MIQHDTYDQALNILRQQCCFQMQQAAALLMVDTPFEALFRDGYDHRAIQMSHDIVPAAWRYRSNANQKILPLAARKQDLASQWLSWLNAEVSSWREAPFLVRLLLKVIAEPNGAKRYRIEDELALALYEHFYDVPWNKAALNLQVDLANNCRQTTK